MPFPFDISSLYSIYDETDVNRNNRILLDLFSRYPMIIESLASVTPEDLNIKEVIFNARDTKHLRSASLRQFFLTHADLRSFPTPPAESSLTVFLDLDRTLLYAQRTAERMRGSYFKISKRPFLDHFLDLLSKIPQTQLVLWSAGSKTYVSQCLAIIDPLEHIKLVVCCDDSVVKQPPNWSENLDEIYNHRKLLTFVPEYMHRSILLDDSVIAGYPEYTSSTASGVYHNPFINVKAFDLSRRLEEGSITHDFTLMHALTYIIYLLDKIQHSGFRLCDAIARSVHNPFEPHAREDHLPFISSCYTTELTTHFRRLPFDLNLQLRVIFGHFCQPSITPNILDDSDDSLSPKTPEITSRCRAARIT